MKFLIRGTWLRNHRDVTPVPMCCLHTQQAQGLGVGLSTQDQVRL